MKLTHFRLLVDDVAACYRFYRDRVGLTPAFDGEGSVYCEFTTPGGAVLALFQRDLMNTATGNSEPAGRDQAVACFAVDDVDAEHERLRAAGVEFVKPPHDQEQWHLRVAFFRDPAGNLIEINGQMKP